MDKCERCNQGITHLYCCEHCEKLAGEITCLSIEKRDLKTAYDESMKDGLEVESQRDEAMAQINAAMKACTWATHKENHTEPKHCIAALTLLLECDRTKKQFRGCDMGCDLTHHHDCSWWKMGQAEKPACKCDDSAGTVGAACSVCGGLRQ